VWAEWGASCARRCNGAAARVPRGKYSQLDPAVAGFFSRTRSRLPPRALKGYNWYTRNFEGYPPKRKAAGLFIL
jgi:hypothetical protein